MKIENIAGSTLDTPDAVKNHLRPRSPFIYNKSTDKYEFDNDRDILEAQYQKSPVFHDSHCIANFIRPVSLATLKCLSRTKPENYKLNFLGKRDSKIIQPILPSHKDDFVDRFNVRSAPSEVTSRESKCKLGNGGQRPLYCEDRESCFSEVFNDENNFIYNGQNGCQLSSNSGYGPDKSNYDQKSSETIYIKPYTISPLSYNFRKQHKTPSPNVFPYPIPSTAIGKISSNDRTMDLSMNHGADLATSRKTTCSGIDQTKFIDDLQRCPSFYKTSYPSPDPGFPGDIQVLQPHPNPTTTYKDIKQDLENLKTVSKQFKIYEKSGQLTEDVACFDNRKNSGMLKVTGDRNILYAIPVHWPNSHSVVILKNHGSYENNYRGDKRPINVHKHSGFENNSSGSPSEPQSDSEYQNEAGVTQMYKHPNSLQDPSFYSKDPFQVYPTVKQVEIDSGNGTDEDDQISRETTSSKDVSMVRNANVDNTCSCSTDSVELDECFSSDTDEDETIVDESGSDDNQYISYQTNEESSTPTANSCSVNDNFSDNENSVNPLHINELSDTGLSDSPQVTNKIDSNCKQSIIEKRAGKDLNVELRMPSKLSHLKLSTFSEKTEKHSTLHVVAYDHNKTKKDIISTSKFNMSKNSITNHNDNLSISNSIRTTDHQNLTVEKKNSKMTEFTELKTSDKNLSLKPISASVESSQTTLSSKEIKTKHKKIPPNRFTQCTRKSHPALIDSLFPNVPPVLRFVEEGQKLEPLPWEFRRLLKWRASTLTPVVVKQTLQRTGFKVSKLTNASEDLETTESSDWIFYFGKHMRPQTFRTIKMYQKVNHIPCSFQLGRKDRLWRNIVEMQLKHGKEHFNFMPQTFCLPGDLDELKKAWDEEGENQRWIMKPPASARGIGVRLVTKWSQIPKKRPALIQKYLSRPYLINDSKFDLRIYVYISSINPLRLYIHEDGLVRFASQKYSNAIRSLGNRYIHLTNYSINRLNSEYISNTNEFAAKGHKWSLQAFWTYLKTKGISPAPIWSNIKDVVVKTIISTEAAFNTAVNIYCNHSLSVHEIFGFDIFLDEDLQPWLLEVNVSPSMHSDSPLDAKIKGGVIKDMLNLSGLHLPEAVEPCCRTISSSCSLKYDRNTPDLLTYTNDVGCNNNNSSTESDNSLSKNDKISYRPIKSAGVVDNLKTKNTKSDFQRPNTPNHRWLIDERLFIQSASTDEEEKMKYFKIRALQYGLPRLKQITLKNNSTMLSYQFERNDSKTLISCKSSVSHNSDENNSSSSYTSNDTDNKKERVCSPCASVYGTNSEVSESRASNISRSSHKNSNNPNLLIPSNTPSHVILKNATNEILDCLTPYDVRILISMIDEFNRAGGFHCVFPPKTSGLSIKYLSFFESPRYTNLLCIAYLQKYGQDKEKGIEMLRRMCEKGIHLKSSLYQDEIASEHHWEIYKKRKSTVLRETIKRKTLSSENLSQTKSIPNS
ncbi:unnamed protein product [Schistosoma turkestanicum]|nr:unnamed protein product [Schistosoma turkestanicum]